MNRKRKYAASPTHSSLSVVDSPHLSAFEAGRIETRVRLSAQGGRSPNASVLFHYVDRTAYRYVRITANGISVGQVGTTLGEPAGVQQNLRMRLATNRWLRSASTSPPAARLPSTSTACSTPS